MKLLTKYTNGNYKVFLFDSGTKIRITTNPKDTEFHAEFPENIDVKITNKCSIGCPFCHEASLSNGQHADFNGALVFISHLKKGTELAIGGGGLSSLPENYLEELLLWCSEYEIFPSITVNQLELENNPAFLKDVKSWIERKFIRGLGISFVKKSDLLENLKNEYPDNVIIHTINGVTSSEDYEYLAKHHFKILILGYKEFRRGSNYKELFDKSIIKKQEWLSMNILAYSKNFKTVSFDNLAIQQLKMKDKISEADWNRYYMGDDGQFTMYVDLVSKTYSMNSTTPESERKPLFKNGDFDIKEIFSDIRGRERNAGTAN